MLNQKTATLFNIIFEAQYTWTETNARLERDTVFPAMAQPRSHDEQFPAINQVLELQHTVTTLGYPPDDQHNPSEHEFTNLKPVDRGRDAWQVLVAAFVFEALFWGKQTCLPSCPGYGG